MDESEGVQVENKVEENLEPNIIQEEDVCRICRSPEKPLLHPCKCSGTIKFVHESCLMDWIKHSKKSNCELCNHQFAFASGFFFKIQNFKLIFFFLRVFTTNTKSFVTFSTFYWDC